LLGWSDRSFLMATSRPASAPAELVPGSGDLRSERVIRPPGLSLIAPFRSLVDLRDRWDLFYTLTLHRLRVRYKQSLLGPAWAVLQPLATMGVLTVVFSYIARIPTGDVPYALFALAGLVPWICFSNAVTTGTQSLVSHAQLVTRVYFPREIVPLTYVCAAVVDGAITAVLLLFVMAVYGVAPGASAWLALPILLLLVALVTAVALAAAATNVRFRDIGVAMPIVLQLLLFASPIAYPLDTVPASVRELYIVNPLAGIIENFRRVLFDTAPLHGPSLAISTLWVVVLLPLAYVWFKQVEATAADVV
jgi:lipopolysaccharide transport system permease protein